MATAEGITGRKWTAAEFEDAVAEMFRRLPQVRDVDRQRLISPREGGRPIAIDMVVRTKVTTLLMPPLSIVEVTGKRGGAALRADRDRLDAAQAVLGGKGLLVAPWTASKQTKEIVSPFEIWDRDRLLDLAKQFPEALAPVLPFLEATKPKPRASTRQTGEQAEAEFPFRPTVSIAQTLTGWRLDCDAFVLPLGERGTLKGATFNAFATDTKGMANGALRKAMGDKELIPERPLICAISVGGLPSRLILATAYRRVGEVHPGAAIAAIIQTAAAAGLAKISLPLIGANLAGEGPVLMAIKQEIERVRLARPLHIVVVVVTDEVAESARRLFPEQQPGPSTTASDFAPLISSDTVGDTVVDRLGVKEQAHTFARLLAATTTPMPLAVGLFGKWGSGKSFFMKLIQQEMDDIAAIAQAGYCTQVAHITFNAWHYVDRDLWASLALRIFDGVAAKLAGRPSDAPPDSDIAEARRSLADGVASNQRLKAEAEAAVVALRNSRRDLETTVANATEDRRRKEGGIPWARVRTILAKADGGQWWDEAEPLLSRFGLSTAGTLADLEKSLTAVNTSARAFEAFLPDVMKGWPKWGRWAALVTGLVGLSFLMPLWDSLREALLGKVASPLEPLAPLVMSLTAVAGWVAKRMEIVKSVPALVEELRKRLELAKGLLTMPPDGEASDAVAKELAELDRKIELNQQRIAEADKELAAAAARLQQVESGALIYDFLRERAADREYLGRTGIISVLREDLRRLEAQLGELRTVKGAKVQRIVLYIDDLDRCEPNQVVDVLQAVHLLLAFKIFAVVVAVDPRWLERSLYRRYLDGADGLSDDEREASDFSPQNYLEKIFQIPYRILPSISDSSFRALVRSLVQPPEATEASGFSPAEDVRDAKPAREGMPSTAGEAEEASGAEPLSESGGIDNDKEEDGPDTVVPAENVSATAAPPLLELKEHEVAAMGALHHFVSTPRAVKRLINVYVMIRMQVAAAEVDLTERLDGEGAGDLITLLGIDIGFPRASQVLRHRLGERNGATDLKAIIDEQFSLCPKECEHLKQQLADLAQAVRSLSRSPDPAALAVWLPFLDRFSFHAAEALGTAAEPEPPA